MSLKRYTNWSYAFAGLAHFAPSGGAGKSARCGALPGTSDVKERVLPSGDQLLAPGVSSRLGSTAVCPESIQRTSICACPATKPTKARRVPSGDKRGEPSLRRPVVNGRCPLPSAATIHRLV